MNHNMHQLNKKIIKCKICPRLIKFRSKIVNNRRKQFKNEKYCAKPITGFWDTNENILVQELGVDAFIESRTEQSTTIIASGAGPKM